MFEANFLPAAIDLPSMLQGFLPVLIGAIAILVFVFVVSFFAAAWVIVMMCVSLVNRMP